MTSAIVNVAHDYDKLLLIYCIANNVIVSWVAIHEKAYPRAVLISFIGFFVSIQSFGGNEECKKFSKYKAF